MGVASCRIIFLLSNFVLNRVRCLVSFRILFRELDSDLWLCVPRDFDPPCGPTRPGPARPGPAPRVPSAPTPPHAPAPPLVSYPHSILPRSNLLSSTSLSLSPCGALGFGDDDRRIWTPR
jgi:hypothetical protein